MSESTSPKPAQLQVMPDDWTRALVIAAHPDDTEYGLAAAVAVWTSAGKDVRYVLATRGEAGIEGMPPEQAAAERTREQIASSAAVGVDVVEFLDHPDGRLVEGLELRRDLAAAIRRHRPELVLTLNHHETWMPGAWNSADHRALGRSVIDAASDAANEWIFPELTTHHLEPWRVKWVGVASSTSSTHAVDVSDGVDAAVRALTEHRLYLAALSDDPVEQQAQRQIDLVTAPNDRFGGRRSVTFELFGF